MSLNPHLRSMLPSLGASLLAEITDALGPQDSPWRVPGDIYEDQLRRDRAGRRAAGAFYSPPSLVDFVVDRTLGPALRGGSLEHILETEVVDLACGGGVFLTAALHYIEELCLAEHAEAVAERFGCDRIALRSAVVEGCLRGFDIDPVAADVSRLALVLAVGSQDPAVVSRCVESIQTTDVLLDSELDQRRFSVIIGNPPWGQKGFKFDAGQRSLLKARFRCATGVLDPFKLFIERAHQLSSAGGRWGMILPDVILLKNQEPVRRLVLAEAEIETIAFAGRAFVGVNIDAVVIVARRVAAPTTDHACSIWHSLPEEWRTAPPPTHTIRQAVFGGLPAARFNIYLDDERLRVLEFLDGHRRLGDDFEIHEGVHSGNCRAKLFVDQQPPRNGFKLVLGREELERYRLTWAGRWIDLSPEIIDRQAGDYANVGRSHWHRRPKIVVRRTGDRVVAAIDREGYYVSNNMFVLLPRDECVGELAAVVALLNSQFMTWYFRTMVPRTGRLFAELKIEHLAHFPIPESAAWNRGRERLRRLSERLEAGDCGDSVEAIDNEVLALLRLPPELSEIINN